MNRFKIALVESGNTSTHVFSRTYLPRAGMPVLGAIMRNLGYRCDIWFEAMSPINEEEIRRCDVVGISSLTNTIDEAYRLADALKRTGNTIVMGGPHVSFMPSEALGHCDYVVLGEGDKTFPALVAALEKGESPHGIKGLAYRMAGGGIQNMGKSDAVDFAQLPSPDFSLAPQVKPGKTPPIITTSRGCPHNCTFCCVTAMFGRKYRFKSNEQVIDELRPVLHRSVCFGDDNFFANPGRTKSLLTAMISNNAVPLRWSGEMAVKAAFDEELLGLMHDTHCRIVYVGIESVDPDSLKRLGKAHEMEMIARCIENLHRYGIGIHGMFVVDPDDTPETVQRIVDYAIRTDIDTIQICSLIPFPGTKSYIEHQSRLLHRDWRYFDGMHVVVEPKHCCAYDMQMAIVSQMLRFYSIDRVIGAYRKGRGWRVRYRAGGHYLMRKWVRENARYINDLRHGVYSLHGQQGVAIGAGA